MANNSILVVGGGFSGITSALEAAEVGHEVFIVEKNPYLGGRVAQLNQYFPKLCPPSCGLEIQFQRIRSNPKVKYFTQAEVTRVTGGPGDFEVTVKLSPRYVNEKCTACGACAQAATTELPCEFDLEMGKRKAAYRPNIFAFPMRYVLTKDACSQDELAKIKASCVYDAIDLADAPREITLNVGAIVWATGWKPYDVTRLENLGAGAIKNVITNMQMERLAAPNGPTNGAVLRPSDNAQPMRVAFVQCAGSRDENHLNYCSYICCMASLKQATYIRERYPKAQVYIYYIDLRTPGRYDNFMKKVTADENLHLIKGKVAAIVEHAATGDAVITVENAVTGIKSDERFDLVVLATGMQPSLAGTQVPGLGIDEDGFVTSAPETGMIGSGCAKLPLDVMKSAQTATAAALKAIQTVAGR